ncbi:MAG: polyprenyl synthetase family protein [Hyphomicrobiaceae bacterium]|nr:MAG: polyprenyl synthetase family protein [Hyphomicrobiaceae bacterium]
MAFSQRLAHAAKLVEARVAVALGGDSAPVRLAEAMRHAALGGGKRFRPFLVLECANLFDVPATAAVHTAAALECVHCYSLVHDDLPAMDNDDLRRGRPTVHKAFDEWTAILAGDGLLTLAFEILASPETHADPAVRADLVLAVARAAGVAGMVGGQCLDLEADKLGVPAAPSLAHVERLQAMKTGALIRFACKAGAILGRAAPEQRSALVDFGERLGRAFQMADDLLDAEGDAATLGKAIGKDAGKATLVSILGVVEAKARLAALEAEALAALAPFGPKADVLREATRFVVERRS